MKAGLVIYGDLNARSGGYFYDQQLVNHLRREGDQVQVFSLTEKDHFVSHLFDNWQWGFWQQLATADLDVLLQDELNHLSLFLGNCWLKSRANYPIVSIIHHLRLNEARGTCANQFSRLVESIYLRTVDAVICNSPTTKKEVEKISTVPKSIVAFPGNDHIEGGQGSSESVSKSGFNILFVGSVIPRKGVHTLIQAIRRLSDEKVHLDLVGSLKSNPEYVASIRQLIQANDLDESVTIHGRVEDEDLQMFYASCDVLAVPSSYEGLGIVYLEAMKHGKPVIATKNGGTNDIITHGKNGYLVEHCNVSELTSRLQYLSKKIELRQQMGEQSRQMAQNHPTWRESMSEVRTFLQTLAYP